MFLIHYMIIFCTKRVIKYQQCADVLHGVNYYYAIGLMIIKRDKWLSRIIKLQKLLKNNFK